MLGFILVCLSRRYTLIFQAITVRRERMLTKLSRYDSTHHNKHNTNILAPLMYTELQLTHLKLRPCHIVSPSDSTVLFSEIGLELFVT
jgi:hypothetical protein